MLAADIFKFNAAKGEKVETFLFSFGWIGYSARLFFRFRNFAFIIRDLLIYIIEQLPLSVSKNDCATPAHRFLVVRASTASPPRYFS